MHGMRGTTGGAYDVEFQFIQAQGSCHCLYVLYSVAVREVILRSMLQTLQAGGFRLCGCFLQ